MADKLYKIVEGMLYNYKTVKAEILNIDIEIEDIRNEYSGCGSINYRERSSPTNKFNSSVENEIVSKEKRIKYLQNKKEGKQKLINRIDNAINTLTLREIEIVHLRYFDKISNQNVAKRLDLTEQRICEIKSSIINKLSNTITLNNI